MGNIIQILTTLGAGQYAIIIMILAIFVDLSPIKLNPIKGICNWIGTYLSKSIANEISGFRNDVTSEFEETKKELLKQRELINEIVQKNRTLNITHLYWDVVHFRSDLRNNLKYSRDEYRHVLQEASDFKSILKDNPDIVISESEIYKLTEAEEAIKKHYDSKRDDETVLYF